MVFWLAHSAKTAKREIKRMRAYSHSEKWQFLRWEYLSKNSLNYAFRIIRIFFVGLLAECREDLALDIDAKRANVVNLKDVQKSFWKFLSGRLVLGVGGHTRFGDAHIVAIALGQAHGTWKSSLRYFAFIGLRQDQQHLPLRMVR